MDGHFRRDSVPNGRACVHRVMRVTVAIRTCTVCDSRVTFLLALKQVETLGLRLTVGQRILVPSVGVRFSQSQPFFDVPMARSSSGLGRRPLKAEITGSNPVRATNTSQVRAKVSGLFSYLEPTLLPSGTQFGHREKRNTYKDTARSQPAFFSCSYSACSP